MKALLIDAYDSFVFIIEQYLRSLALETLVLRCDDPSLDLAIDSARPDFIVLGPGPGRPEEAGYPQLIQRCKGRLPLLGVCLGHQAIGMAFGGTVVRAANCMHGKTSLILHDGHGVFTHTGGRALWATRYHSLIVDPAGLGSDIAVTARSCEDGYVMGLRHRQLPIEGVQFHPESVSTEGGLQIFHSFISSHVQGRPHATPCAGAQDLVTTP
ncbi:anthranilate synthase component II [Rubrivivax sp. RP6-9]|uniref:anthranilate synthase component II n=1 Tax=Rubrivivax sp. RP6-9 TaxID=3415750 RepID=UPI003CC62CCA